MSHALSSCYGPKEDIHLYFDDSISNDDLEDIKNLQIAPNHGIFVFPCTSAEDPASIHWTPSVMFSFLQMLCLPYFDASCYSASRSTKRHFYLPSETESHVVSSPIRKMLSSDFLSERHLTGIIQA